MSTISRTQILRGPCQITWNSGSPMYSKGDVAVTVRTQTLGIATSGSGEVDQRAIAAESKIRFVPSGSWLQHANLLFAPMALTVGQSLFGATDKTLIVKPFTSPQQVLTFKNVAITRMPTLRLTASETIFGEVEFTAIRSDMTTWEVADSIVGAGVYAAPRHAAFDPADHMVQPWTSAWGASPWDSFETETGWTITPGMDLSEQRVDNAGLVDLCVRALSVTAQATPIDVGLNEAAVLAKLGHAGSGRVRGQSLGALGADLVLTSADGGSGVTLDKAALVDAQFGWGAETKRIGQCTWRATRTFTAGVANPLLIVTVP